MSKRANIVPADRIVKSILLIRGHRAIVDADLAALYDVSTKALNQAVKRNAGRFPGDFAFRLTPAEKEEVVTNCDHLARLKFSPAMPQAFTEHGALMAATVLNSRRAEAMSILIIRVFVQFRQMVAGNAELALKVADLERHSAEHGKKIEAIIDAIRALMAKPDDEPNRPRIGYETERKSKGR
jgi:hypothetical protein